MNSSNEKKPLLYVLAGPTAVGKTELSLKLANKLNGEIISADSIQVYKYMDIGSAKITPEEMGDVPHHLIDCLEPTESFDVARFQDMAKSAMSDIYSRSNVPLIVGGTGFYLHALIYDNDFTDGASDPIYRNELEKTGASEPMKLYEELRIKDPEAAAAIPPGNVKRVIRALEYFHVTGEKISEHNMREREKESPYDLKFYVLTMPREILYDRINKRVDIMVEKGLFEETEKLMEMGVKPDMTSMQGLGYKQAYMYLSGEISRDECIERIKKETRHFAKLQLTWFKKEKEAVFIDKTRFGSDDDIIKYMVDFQPYQKGS